MEKEYIKRLFDQTIEFSLKSKGAVIVVGPKWCGKSRTCKRFAKTIIDLMPSKEREKFIELAKISPESFLNYGEKPLLIDEWQHVSFIYDDIKYQVDKDSSFGLFLLTGSVTDKSIFDSNNERTHTGNGRIVKKMMRTLSLFESRDSNGSVSILGIKENRFKKAICKLTLNDYAFFICRGGWPLAIGEEKKVALQQAKDYYEMLVTDDIFSLKEIPLIKNDYKARQVMRSYSRNISIPASDVTLLEDCVNKKEIFDKETFSKYLLALKNLYVIDELPSWNPNLRSKTAIRNKPTRHFVDPSIGAACLGLTPENIFKDITTFGFYFESLVIHDLRIYVESIGGRLYKFRDAQKREADAVIEFQDGSWALVEVKLGNNEDIDLAAKKLIQISNDIDIKKQGNLAFLMVVTKNLVAYRREDGVYVVPLGCLKP